MRQWLWGRTLLHKIDVCNIKLLIIIIIKIGRMKTATIPFPLLSSLPLTPSLPAHPSHTNLSLSLLSLSILLLLFILHSTSTGRNQFKVHPVCRRFYYLPIGNLIHKVFKAITNINNWLDVKKLTLTSDIIFNIHKLFTYSLNWIDINGKRYRIK